jgi:3-hydroxyacyl-[acyl-carrier-protein] dehydratase
MSSAANILSSLPHRYPFLMIDGLVEIELGKRAKGYKNVTRNEWFITEAHPYMPNTMIVEALAQLGAFTAGAETKGLAKYRGPRKVIGISYESQTSLCGVV